MYEILLLTSYVFFSYIFEVADYESDIGLHGRVLNLGLLILVCSKGN